MGIGLIVGGSAVCAKGDVRLLAAGDSCSQKTKLRGDGRVIENQDEILHSPDGLERNIGEGTASFFESIKLKMITI